MPPLFGHFVVWPEVGVTIIGPPHLVQLIEWELQDNAALWIKRVTGIEVEVEA